MRRFARVARQFEVIVWVELGQKKADVKGVWEYHSKMGGSLLWVAKGEIMRRRFVDWGRVNV